MKKLLIIMVMLSIALASAQSTWYPRSADYNTTGDINADNAAFSGDVAITGTLTIGAGAIADGVYDSDLRLDANHSFYSTAGSGGIDWSNGTGTWKMPTGAGTITGTTDFNGAITASDITLDANKNLTMSGTGSFTTGTGTNTLAGDTGVSADKRLAVTTADKLTVGGIIVPQEMVITVPMGPVVDSTVFIADDAWQITKIEEVHTVAENTAYPNTGNLTIRKCTGTEAPSSGDAMHNATMWMNSTINTVVTPTLSGVSANLTLADGDRICMDFNGTMSTYAGGCLTIHMKRV